MSKGYVAEWNGLLRRDSIAVEPVEKIKQTYRNITIEDVEEAFREIAVETNTTTEVPQVILVDTSRMNERQIIEYLDTLSKQDEI